MSLSSFSSNQWVEQELVQSLAHGFTDVLVQALILDQEVLIAEEMQEQLHITLLLQGEEHC